MFKLTLLMASVVLAASNVQCDDQTLQYLAKEFVRDVRGACNPLRLRGMTVIQEAVRYTCGKLEPNTATLSKAIVRYLEFTDGPLNRFNKDSILAGAELHELCLDKVYRPCRILSNAVERSGQKLVELGYDVNNSEFIENLTDVDLKALLEQGKICRLVKNTEGLCRSVLALSRSGSRGY